VISEDVNTDYIVTFSIPLFFFQCVQVNGKTKWLNIKGFLYGY